MRTWRRCARCAAPCLADIASARPRAFLRQPEDLDRVEKRLKSINTLAPILRCERANVSVDNVLNICGFDLDRTLEMDPEFLNTDNEHEHDDTVSSVSFVNDDEVILSELEGFISYLMREKGTDLFRVKGVLAVANTLEKFVCHSVHMLFSGDFQPWRAGEKRGCKLVLIGKNLDEADLRARFEACVSTPEKQAELRRALRFAVGDKVECRIREGWALGTVIAHMYTDEYMRPGFIAPYQVKLDDGAYIFAPKDSDEVIRKPE